MSWVSPRMSSSSSSSAPASGSAAPAPASTQTVPPPPPETPSSVPDLHAGLCRDVIRFRHFLAQYRALDDRITSLLNRSLASSRDAGRNPPPALLLPLPAHSTSPLLEQQHRDAGTSTYARADPGACATLWDQLVRVWRGREESVRYCLAVSEAARGALSDGGAAALGAHGIRPPAGASTDELAALDADRVPSAPADSGASTRRARKVQDRDAARDPEHWRGADEDGWRGKREAEEDALIRQLHNELVVDQILRRRSKEVFRSRCPNFRPPEPQQAPAVTSKLTGGATSGPALLDHSWRYWQEP